MARCTRIDTAMTRIDDDGTNLQIEQICHGHAESGEHFIVMPRCDGGTAPGHSGWFEGCGPVAVQTEIASRSRRHEDRVDQILQGLLVRHLHGDRSCNINRDQPKVQSDEGYQAQQYNQDGLTPASRPLRRVAGLIHRSCLPLAKTGTRNTRIVLIDSPQNLLFDFRRARHMPVWRSPEPALETAEIARPRTRILSSDSIRHTSYLLFVCQTQST